MNRVATGALVLLVAFGLSAYVYTVYQPGLSNNSTSGSTASSVLGGSQTGTMIIYLADPPPQNQTLKYLLVNVTSITLKYSSNVTETSTTTASSSTNSTTSTGSSTTVTSSTTSVNGFAPRYTFNVSSSLGTNVNLTKLQGSGILLGSPTVPAGNVTGIILNITGARAYWTTGGSTQLKVVADGKLMINVHFEVQSGGTTNLTLDIVPGDIHVSPGQASVLRPVIMVTAASRGPQGAQTVTTTETETETTSSSSSGSA